MKLVWSPETASKALIDTVKSCEIFDESSAAELVSAMAAGWNAQLLVETWRRGGPIAASVGLSVAAQHSGGRHICVVADEESKAEYVEAMRESGRAAEVVVGSPEEAMEGLEGIDFLVADWRRNDLTRILRAARLGHRGAVVVCKNATSTAVDEFRWRQGKLRIVRSVFLPVGNGLHIAHVGAAAAAGKGQSRWIKHIDRRSGEEIVFRR
ncbi:uncharacterized protein LOC131025812 [Salvia miltiorrhiza]|uniref:uncharacterized protein LOC131025812 n=1 Tax=Salvia miltiorrhiza TaxID=226208 RepID=UPI0025ACB52A|nr:uncharacterized protein LOC131025812 [Salvia miltiorrhiza]